MASPFSLGLRDLPGGLWDPCLAGNTSLTSQAQTCLRTGGAVHLLSLGASASRTKILTPTRDPSAHCKSLQKLRGLGGFRVGFREPLPEGEIAQ